MSGVYICGLGAVSPAGWTLEHLREALRKNEPLPTSSCVRPGHSQVLQTRPVPPPTGRPAFLAHPRLRRTSPITHHAAAATLEAFGPVQPKLGPKSRLGLVCCFQSGCVQYSSRFFEEAIKNPETASPLAFPETVFAAPTSHIAALLNNVVLASSFIGDPAAFLQGLAAGAQWLACGRVDACLVVGAEENHWLLADALWHFQHSSVFASGAGVICLSSDPALSLGVELGSITDAHTFTLVTNRLRAAQQMRAQLPLGSREELLLDGLDGSPRTNAAEKAAWQDWPGARLSPKRVFGEGLMASAAWACVAACDAVARGQTPAANVSLVGCNQQAIGARFIAHARL